MIDAAGKAVRISLSCGCIYDPNEEKNGPGSGTIAIQGNCQIAAAAWAIERKDGSLERYKEVSKAHDSFRESLRTT